MGTGLATRLQVGGGLTYPVCVFVQAQEMADHAFQFVLDHLLPEHIYCYMVSLLKVCMRYQVSGIRYQSSGMGTRLSEGSIVALVVPWSGSLAGW